jgi:hypothetical protein
MITAETWEEVQEALMAATEPMPAPAAKRQKQALVGTWSKNKDAPARAVPPKEHSNG